MLNASDPLEVTGFCDIWLYFAIKFVWRARTIGISITVAEAKKRNFWVGCATWNTQSREATIVQHTLAIVMTPRKEIDGAEIFSNKELRNFEIVQKAPHHVCDYVNLLVHIEKRSVCKQRNKRAKLKNGSVPRRGKSADTSVPPVLRPPRRGGANLNYKSSVGRTLLFCAGLQQ